MLKGFVCPPHGEEPGRKNKINYCLTKCTKKCAAPPLLAAMLEQEKQNPHAGNVISATMLTGGCKRQTYLRRTVDYYEEPDNKLPLFRGTLIHKLVEAGNTKQVQKAGFLLEHHMEMDIETQSGKWILSATSDIIDTKEKVLYDVKTLQEYALNLLIKGKERGKWSTHIPDSYTLQANIYRYMAKKLGIVDIKRLRLQIIGFGSLIITGSSTTLREYKKRKGLVETTYDIPDVPILPDETVEYCIKVEGEEWYKILYSQTLYPSVCNDDWSWLCKKCVFKGTKHCPDPDKERKGDWVF